MPRNLRGICLSQSAFRNPSGNRSLIKFHPFKFTYIDSVQLKLITFNTVKTVKRIMSKMQKKKSAGADEISQECLLMGRNVLASPLRIQCCND